MVHWIYVVVRVLAGLAGLTLVYAATFLYEDEQGKLQNRLEQWWVEINDKQKTATSHYALFMREVAKVATGLFDRLFGPKLFSLHSLRVSAAFSMGSYPTSFCGLPSLFPLERAFRNPARTRSAIRLRSSSATAPRPVKTIFPAGVEVSICSENETKSIPRALKVSSALSRWATERANLSKRHTQTTSKRLLWASAISRLSSGRESLAPLTPSSMYSPATCQPRASANWRRRRSLLWCSQPGDHLHRFCTHSSSVLHRKLSRRSTLPFPQLPCSALCSRAGCYQFAGLEWSAGVGCSWWKESPL